DSVHVHAARKWVLWVSESCHAVASRNPAMAVDSRVQQLLDEISDSGCTPEEVCLDCPELLPEVRRRWLQMRIVEAELDALFPTAGSDPVLGGRSGEAAGEAAGDPDRDRGAA